MAYQFTTACKKLLGMQKRIRGVCGGTSAGKTIAILLWLIDYAQTHEGELISVVSETFPHLKRGVIRDFLSIMEEHKYFVQNSWNKTDYIYTFENKSKIEFFSADQPSKVRGHRRDILFINEVNNIEYETYIQLEIRTKKIIFLDWNPVSEFWFYLNLLNKKDVDFLTLTYKDNEALEKSIIESIESKKDNVQWYKVYGLGELGEAEERIYTGWELVDEIPYGARLESLGLDFGYTRDPACIIGVYYVDGFYIIDEKLYARQQSNKMLADFLLMIYQTERAITVADSAEPKSIDEIASYGISIVPCDKTKDARRFGIKTIQDLKIKITKRSTNTIKEYRNYIFAKDRDGKLITPEIPVEGMDHAMDALRYAFSSIKPNNRLKTDIADTRNIDTTTW